MHTTYYLDSAQDVNTDLLDSIKATFKSKSITITVEEMDCEDENTYLTEDELFDGLKKKYDI